jgi:hypothetical protein
MGKENQNEEQGERKSSDLSTTQNTTPTTQNHLAKNLKHLATSKTNPNLVERGGKTR